MELEAVQGCRRSKGLVVVEPLHRPPAFRHHLQDDGVRNVKFEHNEDYLSAKPNPLERNRTVDRVLLGFPASRRKEERGSIPQIGRAQGGIFGSVKDLP